MPPKISLVRLATRRSPYVCHSCLSGLANELPKPSAVRAYARASKAQARLSSKTRKPVENSSRATSETLYTVKYFEKDAKGEVREVPVGEDADNVDMEDIRALEASAMAKLKKLDATLESMNKKAEFLEDLLKRHGPKGAFEAYQDALETYEVGNDTTPIPLIDEAKYRNGNPVKRAEVHKMNKALTQLNRSIERCTILLRKNQLDRTHIAKLWVSFVQARNVLSDPKALVPDSAWNNLWAIIAWESHRNPHRMAHILTLCQVMAQHGKQLSDEWQLLHIEAAFSEGYENVGIANWKRLRPTLGQSRSTAMAFWELGVRIWSRRVDIERAERACQAVLDRASPSTPADSRVLLHLIRAYTSTTNPDDADKGFRLYRRMRDLAADLDKPMEIDDYDDVISIFLTTSHTDYAMYVFTDMIYSGAVNLYGNTKLPNSLKNTFFFGKWLKRLIGAGDLEGAFKVLVYMQKNGVMAAAVQVNGLIGAWLRSGTTDNREKAELLAWSMVHARKAFVELRHRERSAEWPVRLYDNRPNNYGSKHKELDYTMVPRATTETFILLAENYRERGLFRRLEDLFVAYKECEMGGDAMMMNELIMAGVSQGNVEKARELYDLMVHEYAVLPNTDTYAVLFKSLFINTLRGTQLHKLAPEKTTESKKHARSYFSDLVSSIGLHLDRRRTRHGELSEEQVKLILHSFRKCGDWAGVIVALVCLRDLMRFKITRNVLMEMIAEYEGIDHPSARTTKLVMLTTMKLQTMIERMGRRRLREREAKDAAVEASKAMDPNGVKDPHVLYDILLEYYYTKLQADYRNRKELELVLREAESEMGAADIVSFEPSSPEDELDISELV